MEASLRPASGAWKRDGQHFGSFFGLASALPENVTRVSALWQSSWLTPCTEQVLGDLGCISFAFRLSEFAEMYLRRAWPACFVQYPMPEPHGNSDVSSTSELKSPTPLPQLLVASHLQCAKLALEGCSLLGCNPACDTQELIEHEDQTQQIRSNIRVAPMPMCPLGQATA